MTGSTPRVEQGHTCCCAIHGHRASSNPERRCALSCCATWRALSATWREAVHVHTGCDASATLTDLAPARVPNRLMSARAAVGCAAARDPGTDSRNRRRWAWIKRMSCTRRWLRVASAAFWRSTSRASPRSLGGSQHSPLLRVYGRIRYPPLGWYDIDYAYDPSPNSYLRVMDGYRHRDQLQRRTTGGHEPDRSGRGRRSHRPRRAPGPGAGRRGPRLLLRRWRGRRGQLDQGQLRQSHFFWDSAGNLVRVNAGGATWIQIVPPEARAILA